MLFHTDHLHGSEINRNRATRYVVSFRITFGRPHFPRGHYHAYCHAGLARGPLRAMASWPALLQASYARSLAQRVTKRLLRATPTARPSPAPGPEPKSALALSDLPVGEIRAFSPGICVARLDATRIVAVSRVCPHAGADLADGFVDGDRIVCPWHNLPFDPETGASPRATLRPLRRFAARVELADGRADIPVVPQEGPE